MKRKPTILLLLIAMLVPAASVADEGDEPIETIEVKRTEEEKPRKPTLRFLKDHRVFIRSQLDRLSTEVKRTREGSAEALDERYLWLQQMAAAIAAANDTITASHRLTTGDSLLTSINDLGRLEAQLAYVEQLLAEHRDRLLGLEQDFLGHQKTSLVILLRGFPKRDAPRAIVVGEGSDYIRVDLTAEQRASLEQGGIAQIFHEFVEPREHRYIVSFLGNSWDSADPVAVTVEAERNRLTFLELELDALSRGRNAMGLVTNVWYR
jgi:hypothetical protein